MNAGEKESYLTITPLGGLGEIGMNCQLWETNAGIVMIDCGLMFPDDYHLGIDVVIPRFDSLYEKKDQFLGIVLTHGHEDHIGALPWLVPQFKKVQIYGSPFTLALVEHKLTERGLIDRVELNVVEPYSQLTLGDLKFHFFPVCHSIPQSYSLGIDTPIGRMLHTGDFKLDSQPLHGDYISFSELKKFGENGLKLLLSDSTNIETEGYSRPEREVRDGFNSLFQEAKGRIVITLFSSHIDRIRTVFEMAELYGKKVIVSGRSLNANIDKAQQLGLLERPDFIYNDYEGIPEVSPENTVIMATGSQGEPLSALTRIANGYHRQLKIMAGDTVIMSSRVIPGNAKAVARLINQIYKLGAKVIHSGEYCIHATGHGCKGELKAILEAFTPEYFIPVHGEYRHLVQHANLAKELSVDPEKVVLLEDGSPLTLYKKGHKVEKHVLAESVLVDGKGVGDVGRLVLKERRILGDEGMVIVVLVISADGGEVLHGPEIFSRGFVFEQRYSHVLEDSKCLVLDVLESTKNYETTRLEEKIRINLRGFFKDVLSRDPVVVPIISLV